MDLVELLGRNAVFSRKPFASSGSWSFTVPDFLPLKSTRRTINVESIRPRGVAGKVFDWFPEFTSSARFARWLELSGSLFLPFLAVTTLLLGSARATPWFQTIACLAIPLKCGYRFALFALKANLGLLDLVTIIHALV